MNDLAGLAALPEAHLQRDHRDHRSLNADLADLVVAALENWGVQRVYVCPGSRSTPLVFALARSTLPTEVLLDERSAGYALVGAARAGSLAAVVTTSGTAVANLVPGLVEADVDQLPVVVVSADRPHRLMGRGANQTIRQPALLHSLMRRQLDLDVDAILDSSVLEITIHDLQAVGAHLVGPRRGPVHLNVRFEKPLEPGPRHLRRHFMLSTSVEIEATVDDGFAKLEGELQGARRGLVVVGALPPSHHRAAIAMLRRADEAGWPVILDPVSGLSPDAFKHASDDDDDAGAAVLSPHLTKLPTLRQLLCPDMVLWLGGRTTEDDVATFLLHQQAHHDTTILQWRGGDAVVDPEGLMTRSVVGNAEDVVSDAPLPTSSLASSAHAIAHRVRDVVDATLAHHRLTEPQVAVTVVDAAARHQEAPVLFVGNSMPMRDVARFTQLRGGQRLIANRGASGIDGNFGTALGAARATRGLLWALLGDLSALHDLSGLAVLAHAAHGGDPDAPPLRGRIVVVNNEGGGIFSFLPVAALPAAVASTNDVVSRAFLTPHRFRLADVAASLGLRAIQVTTVDELRAALFDDGDTADLSLIEVCTDKGENRDFHRALDAAVDDALKAALRTLMTSTVTP